jgi:hypothetical protein
MLYCAVKDHLKTLKRKYVLKSGWMEAQLYMVERTMYLTSQDQGLSLDLHCTLTNSVNVAKLTILSESQFAYV